MYTLGIYLAVNGKNYDKVEYMHKKATAWATSIRAGGVHQNESWKYLNSKIPQTIKHPLLAMTLNEKECKHIMQTIVKFGLTKARISSTLHTEVIYGTRYHGSIGIFGSIVIQGAGGISFIIKHCCNPTPSSPLLRADLSTLKLEAGRGGHILENNYPKTQLWLYTESWIYKVRKLISAKHIHISHLGTGVSTQHAYNACLTTHLALKGKFNTSELRVIIQ